MSLLIKTTSFIGEVMLEHKLMQVQKELIDILTRQLDNEKTLCNMYRRENTLLKDDNFALRVANYRLCRIAMI